MLPSSLAQAILAEDARRSDALFKGYEPMTGKDAPGMRFIASWTDFMDGKALYLPIEMLQEDFIRALFKFQSFEQYIAKYMADYSYQKAREAIVRRFCRIRCKHDFYFFAYAYARIKNKEGGPDVPFYLRPAQVKVTKIFEKMRLGGVPIYVILLKCRQWGGSTLTDIYMGWIMIFWKTSWNCNIVGHQSTSSITVFNMYERLMNSIPYWLFFDTGDRYPEDVRKIKNDAKNPNIKYLVPRSCKIQTGSALNPEAARSDDVAMAHITEEAFFPDTEKWTPAKVVKSVISPINGLPYNFIVRESTPNGRENEFHDEWQRAKAVDDKGEKLSAYTPVFVAWFEIETYVTRMTDEEKRDFLNELYLNRNDTKYNGEYYWNLIRMGATLEGIKWYIQKAKSFDSYPCLDDMQQEFPSDDIEAFKYSGRSVFDIYKVDELKDDCEIPAFVGDIEGDSTLPTNPACIEGIRIVRKNGGPLRIWDMPDFSEKVRNRYLIAVDIGGSHKTSDFTDMVVFDRYDCMYGGVPCVVAEWHGHCNPDQLAMKCAQLAIFYDNAFLVIENNTAYSRMNDTDGDISELLFPILIPLYDNLYNSSHSKTLKHRQKELRWGYNTNTATKVAMVHNLAMLIRTSGYIEKEEEVINEYSYFMQFDDGKYGAVPGKHDDRVMARAIALQVHNEMDPPMIVQQKTPEEIRREKMKRLKPKAPEILPLG